MKAMRGGLLLAALLAALPCSASITPTAHPLAERLPSGTGHHQPGRPAVGAAGD